MPLGPFAAATDASPAIRHAGRLLKSGARQSLIALVLSLFTPTTPAHAATFTVTNLNNSGGGSLREAITNANAAPGADTIFFSVSGTITLASTLPTITDGLTINGGGQVLTISGNNAVPVMQVDFGTSLTLLRVTIANANAVNSSGGGINNQGTLTITNSTFSGNSAAGAGGAIYNGGNGTLTITNSTFSGNSAADIGLSGVGGGGIYNGGTSTITNSTFSGNSTLSASGGGGGIHNTSNPLATLTITNSTFSGNSAPNGSGGGILNDAVVTAVTLRNTIVANSVGGNCGGPITNGGNNIDSGTTCGWGAVSGSMSSTNPLLGALANNFAETQTFALLTGSPAIDGVTFSPPNGAPSTDQRGVARPQGGGYDIGAFEVAPGALFIVNTSADTDDSFCDVLGGGVGNNHDCTLREAIDAADAAFGPDTITFSVSGTITLASMLPLIDDQTGMLTIDGTGQTLTVSGNNAVRVMQVSGGASLTLNNVTIADGAFDFGGGGVFNLGSVTISNSTFSGNSAGNGSGGGIFNSGTLTITNSTFSGNSASSFGNVGGGIFSNGGTLTITNSTFSGNSASASGGAGIHNIGAGVTLRNTIVANSVGSGNCGGAITNGGNNIDSGTTCGWAAVSGSMSNTNPLLGALASNGGPTQTLALLTGSPAIHGVTVNAPNSAPSTDQRGVARPQGVRYDIGAYEFTGAQAGPALIVNASADTNDGFCSIPGEGTGNHDCTLREAINAANALAGANSITFSVGGTITLASTLPAITDVAGLTIDGVGQILTISGNNAVGVMEVTSGRSLTLNRVTIANGNHADSGGGILNNGGTLTITNSTFSGNSAYLGGGIYNFAGPLTITNSTFSGNSAPGGGSGGGIFNTGALAITNSTFSGNSASDGGGIYSSIGTVLTITNSTFSGNSAPTGGGAGIFNNSVTGVTVRNTIVANSVGPNCGGVASTNGGNNIDDGTTCGWAGVSGSMSSTNPLLGALANNGGPTQTFALLPSSPAIDGVVFSAPNSAPSTDQRGLARPQGVRYDIGAYESLGTQAGPAFMVNAAADTNDGVCDSPGQGIGNHDCTLREAINAANALAGASTISFSVGGTITLASTLPAITDAAGLTMDGAGQTLTISGNSAVRVMQVGAGASLTLNNLTIANGTGSGGGINNSGTLTVTNSTFSGNSVTGGTGAAINNGGTLTITNSTFSGNSANSGSGGGVFNNGGPVTITNSTFSGNSAPGGFGAGVYNNNVAAQMTIRNTIVANSVGAGNCGGGNINGGNNIDTGTTCGWGAVSGSISSTNPLLGALANNGGRTQTFALLPGSPAIDGVVFSAPNGAPSTDQRGLARPRGVRYDIGSYEAQLFTDDPLTAGLTTVKAVHVTELRIRIDAVRIAKGLGAYAWSDLSLGPSGWLIRAQHIIDLRTALSEAYVQAARTPPAYAVDPSLAPGVVVKAAHIAEIRAAIVAIE